LLLFSGRPIGELQARLAADLRSAKPGLHAEHAPAIDPQ
jgi:hypothetical protein